MKPTYKLHKCVEHHENCKREWQAMSVEDEPIYTVCEHCVEIDCQDEQELINELN